MDAAERSSPPAARIRVERDYSGGTGVCFQNNFPPELNGKVLVYCCSFINVVQMSVSITNVFVHGNKVMWHG